MPQCAVLQVCTVISKISSKIVISNTVHSHGACELTRTGITGYFYCQYSDRDRIGMFMEETNTGHSNIRACAYGITTHHCDYGSSVYVSLPQEL